MTGDEMASRPDDDDSRGFSAVTRGKVIQFERGFLGLSQGELALVARVSRGTVRNGEQGAPLERTSAFALARAFGWHPEALVTPPPRDQRYLLPANAVRLILRTLIRINRDGVGDSDRAIDSYHRLVSAIAAGKPAGTPIPASVYGDFVTHVLERMPVQDFQQVQEVSAGAVDVDMEETAREAHRAFMDGATAHRSAVQELIRKASLADTRTAASEMLATFSSLDEQQKNAVVNVARAAQRAAAVRVPKVELPKVPRPKPFRASNDRGASRELDGGPNSATPAASGAALPLRVESFLEDKQVIDWQITDESTGKAALITLLVSSEEQSTLTRIERTFLLDLVGFAHDLYDAVRRATAMVGDATPDAEVIDAIVANLGKNRRTADVVAAIRKHHRERPRSPEDYDMGDDERSVD